MANESISKGHRQISKDPKKTGGMELCKVQAPSNPAAVIDAAIEGLNMDICLARERVNMLNHRLARISYPSGQMGPMEERESTGISMADTLHNLGQDVQRMVVELEDMLDRLGI